MGTIEDDDWDTEPETTQATNPHVVPAEPKVGVFGSVEYDFFVMAGKGTAPQTLVNAATEKAQEFFGPDVWIELTMQVKGNTQQNQISCRATVHINRGVVK